MDLRLLLLLGLALGEEDTLPPSSQGTLSALAQDILGKEDHVEETMPCSLFYNQSWKSSPNPVASTRRV